MPRFKINQMQTDSMEDSSCSYRTIPEEDRNPSDKSVYVQHRETSKDHRAPSSILSKSLESSDTITKIDEITRSMDNPESFSSRKPSGKDTMKYEEDNDIMASESSRRNSDSNEVETKSLNTSHQVVPSIRIVDDSILTRETYRSNLIVESNDRNIVRASHSLDDISANADAVFQKAIQDMRFDRPAIRDIETLNEHARANLDKRTDKNNIPDEDYSVLEFTMDVEAPPRRANRKMQAIQQKDSKSLECLATDQNIPRKKIERDNVAGQSVSMARCTDDENKSAVTSGRSNFFVDSQRNPRTYDQTGRKSISLENLRASCERDILREGSPTANVIEGSPIERNTTKVKEKRTIGSLRNSFEKKMESVEKMLEDRMEKIWEENVEKYPWLLPIETWIVDHCKPSGTYNLLPHGQHSRNARTEEQKTNDTEKKPSYVIEPVVEVKFTAAQKEDEEPKIESRLVEHLRKIRKAGSPKPERSGFDATQLISRLRKTDNLVTHPENTEETVNPPIESEDVLDVKDVKHNNHDLFDRLMDNVKGKMEDIHRYFQRTNRLADVNRRLKSQIWSSVVTIVLVEAKNLLPMDIDGLSDPYVKFRLGTEKYKSKVVNKTLNPVWLEQFDLHLYEDPHLGQELEVTVWDRDKSHQDDLMGRTVIDLATLERETTHRLWRELEDGSGNIFLLLTISGTTASETISDLAVHEETPRERVQLYQRYSFLNTLQRLRDVGHLTVKVYRAQGLAAADLGGKSDPFCVLELVNARLQTQTEYKTLAPNWQKIFTFNVKDINSVLEVTVYDEDRDHKVEFLGKVAIPLLKIRNGEKRWYALKDKKLRGRAKGNSPQILLEMTVVWNIFRACIRTLNPKEKKYMEPEMKFKRQVFLRNVLRLKAIIVIFIDIGKYMQSCWEWESKMRSIIALVLFILGCYYFEPYMIPAAALLILLKYYLLRGDGSGLNQWISGQVAVITGAPLSHHSSSHYHDFTEGTSDDCAVTPGDDDDDEDDKDKEEKKSLKERLQAIQEVTQTVQNSIGYMASLCERVKNLFNFTVPYLSYLAMLLALLGVAVLYFIPVRYLIMVWGVNKFSRKIFRPHSVPNNEILDLLSRVPDDEELLNYRELKPFPTADCEKGSSASPGSSNMTRREQRKRHKAA